MTRYIGYTLGNDSVVQGPPDLELMARMDEFVSEMTESGTIVATGGFAPIATGTVKISYDAGEFTVTDGPFAEAKELVGGWALIEVDSEAEAVAMTKRFLTVAGGGDITLRRVAGPEDFPAGLEAAAAANSLV